MTDERTGMQWPDADGAVAELRGIIATLEAESASLRTQLEAFGDPVRRELMMAICDGIQTETPTDGDFADFVPSLRVAARFRPLHTGHFFAMAHEVLGYEKRAMEAEQQLEAAREQAVVLDESGTVALCRRCGFVTWYEKDNTTQHEEGCSALSDSEGEDAESGGQS